MHALLLAMTGQLEDASREIGSLENIGIASGRLKSLRELLEVLTGGRDKADALRNSKPSLAPQGTYAYLLLDMKEEAVANIQAGIDVGFLNGMYHYSYPSLVKNPWYKPLRDDPRFQDILKKQKAAYLRELKPLENL